ncbi:hypothetical protein Tco_0584182 [Tanacetum coccineum]
MGDTNSIRTLKDYSKPSHEGYKNTIELPEGNNMVPLLSDTILTAKLRNDILMFQQHQRESLSETWTRFQDLLQKVPHHDIDFWLQVQIFYDRVTPATRRTIDQSSDGKLHDRNAKESWALLEDLALYDNEMSKITSSCEIFSGPHDTQYCIEDPEQAFVEYASSRIDEAGGKWYTFKPEQNNLGDTYNPSWKSHPNLRWRQPQNSQNNFSNPPNRFQPNGSIWNHSFNNNPQRFNSQSNLEGLMSNFMASQDARLSKFEADFKQQQSEMTNKIDTVLKAITNRMAGALPSDTVKNPKLNVNSTSLVLSARFCHIEDPQCSTRIHSLINTITIHQSNPHNNKLEEEEQEEKDDPENINTDPSSPPDPSVSFIIEKVLNKITSSCEIFSGSHDTQYCMENPEQAFVEYTSSRIDEAGDARLSKFEADFKQQQSEMTNKIDTVLKAVTDRIARALPSDTVKNPKLNVNSTSLVWSARSYPIEDPKCSTQIHGSINTITVYQSNPHNNKPEKDAQKGEGNPKNTNAAEREEEQRDAPQPELKDPTDIKKISLSRHDEERGIEWLDVKEPLDFVDTSEELVYESLIKEMPKCSVNYDFRIKKGDPRNLKIPCMIGHIFTANAYVDIDLPMNIMSLAYYNSVRKSRYEYRGRNFVGLGRDMHVFVGNMSYIMDFTILENIETNIDPSLSHVVFGRPFVEIACLAINRKHGLMTFTDGTKEIIFKTPYKDPEMSELSSNGHDLLSSRIILSEDDYDRGCRKPSDLED